MSDITNTKIYNPGDLEGLTMRELYDICKSLKIKNYTSFKKEDLVNEVCLVSQGKKVIVRKKRGRKSKAELEKLRLEQEDSSEDKIEEQGSEKSIVEEKIIETPKDDKTEKESPAVASTETPEDTDSQGRPKLMFPPKKYSREKTTEKHEARSVPRDEKPLDAIKTQELPTETKHKEVISDETEDRPKESNTNGFQYKGESQGDGKGVLEIHPDGYGFLRVSYVPNPDDIYMAPSQIRKFHLRNGDYVEGLVRHPSKSSEKYSAMLRLNSVNGLDPSQIKDRPIFEKMVPIFPDERLILEVPGLNDITLRLIELFSPIGKGQRGMIVSPPKAGKTTVIKKIAQAISTNHPEVILMIVLVDERPEEVTDMQRSVKAQVIHSTFDQLPENHIRVVELAMERAKRLVELGHDVVILMDGITRLTRAYNLVMSPTGRTLTGGLDTSAIHGPKRVLGAARNMDGGGSLTVLATALIETGSRMDEVIYEEYKGTGNMELVLDRKLAEKGLFPAIDINKSGTRRDELLYEAEERKRIWSLRRFLSNLDTDEALKKLVRWMKESKSNEQFLRSIVSNDKR